MGIWMLSLLFSTGLYAFDGNALAPFSDASRQAYGELPSESFTKQHRSGREVDPFGFGDDDNDLNEGDENTEDGDGNANDMPVSDGVWVLLCLATLYVGVRNRRQTE